MVTEPAKGSVLIVDASGPYRSALRAAFAQVGLQVEEAEDGEAALAHFARTPYDVVVLGMKLRQLDGPTTCYELRKLAHGKTATIVALADADDTDTIASALAMGATEYVPRSSPLAVIQKRIEHMALCAASRRKSARRLAVSSNHDARRRTVDGVSLRYEPRIDARSYQVTGFECVPHRDELARGRASSGSFMSVAEREGFVVELGERMLRQACRDVRALRRATGIPLRATLPVTSGQMRESKFLGRVAEALECGDAEPSWLELELTEGVLLGAERDLAPMLRALREMGVGVALADFGATHTSFHTLGRFPLAALRITRAFVRDVVTHPDGPLILRSIAEAARARGQRVIAEGVDFEEQLNFLTGLGCDEFQGPFVGAPLTYSAFLEWMQSRAVTVAPLAESGGEKSGPTRRPDLLDPRAAR